jgi:hypothetical protein
MVRETMTPSYPRTGFALHPKIGLSTSVEWTGRAVLPALDHGPAASKSTVGRPNAACLQARPWPATSPFEGKGNPFRP